MKNSNSSKKKNSKKKAIKTSVSLITEEIYQKELTNIFSNTFSMDPAFVWIYQKNIWEKFSRLCPILFNLGLKYKALYYSGKEPNGFALWIPPGVDVTFAELIRLGFLGALFDAGLFATIRLLRAFIYNENKKPKLMPENSWYLFFLAVDENFRNQKIGEQLLKPVLAHADKNNHHCYLESSNPRNLNFYRKMGFDIVFESTLGNLNDSPQIFFLLRKPRSKY
ncbi:MAG: GNAT family N-acetyltransferase [Spirochaetia bacterium]|nr:GNAT family N-acetyltransferase [Spirochaetia bacterium]